MANLYYLWQRTRILQPGRTDLKTPPPHLPRSEKNGVKVYADFHDPKRVKPYNGFKPLDFKTSAVVFSIHLTDTQED